jgi:hypothetical protein
MDKQDQIENVSAESVLHVAAAYGSAVATLDRAFVTL